MININATLILTVLNFILLIAVLAKILWKPMVEFLDERARMISDSLKLAEENKQRSEEMHIERDEIIKEARTKAAEIVDTAMTSASDESRAIVAEARENAQATVAAAKEDMRMEAERIKQELRHDIASMTVSLAGKVLDREIKEDDHKELIRKSLDVMGS